MDVIKVGTSEMFPSKDPGEDATTEEISRIDKEKMGVKSH